MVILLAGGASYIGSHTAVELLNNGHDVNIADDLSNSSVQSIERIETIIGKNVKVYQIDVKDKDAVGKVFAENHIDCVIHFAGLKAVGESVQQPIRYYLNSIDTTLTLMESMREHGVDNIVFSSSATVYGEACAMPCIETMQRGNCTNPYGWTKYMLEQILEDVARAYPICAHESGLIGEDPKSVPNNLMPYVTQIAVGKREKLTVFGGDDDTTCDGTCRRDFIHVMDLAQAHVKAIEYAVQHKGMEVFNVGTGTPYSVLDIINTFEKVNGVKVNYEIGPRRAGDLPEGWVNVDKAAKILGWRSERDLAAMCKDAWNWQIKNPNGYEKNVTPLVVVLSGKLKIQNLQKGLAKNIEKLLASNSWGTKRYLNMKHYMQR